MRNLDTWLLVTQMAGPAMGLLALTARVLLASTPARESTVYRIIVPGLALSAVSSWLSAGEHALGLALIPDGEVDLGTWLRVADYRIPLALTITTPTLVYAALGATLTLVIAVFSRTYLHREPGFARFYAVLGLVATGTQLVALAGALELFFAGWELLGLASALLIGFYHERDEPLRSSVRAFATFRAADAGLLLATVGMFSLFGSTRFADLETAHILPSAAATALAAGLLLSAMGKSAQLPFSDWLPRAMEGPTPSSALCYGAVSIHAGVFLLIRVQPVLAAAPLVQAAGIALGLLTAAYAVLIARTHPDAKGALAHATLAQVGLMVAEVCAGWPGLALAHMTGHALLRLGQFLRAPNLIHDHHRIGTAPARPMWLHRHWPRLAERLYAQAVHRLRLDDHLQQVVAPAFTAARWLDRTDARFRRLTDIDARGPR